MKLTIQEIQKIETEIVKEVVEICKKHNIDYFLHCGSALGAIRHGGPIPWDLDVDIIVPFNQYNKFLMTVRKEISDKFFVDYYDINPYFTPLFFRIGLKGYSTALLHIDVFRMIGISSNSDEQQKVTKKLRYLSKIYFAKMAGTKYIAKISFKRKLSNIFYKTISFYKSIINIRKEFDAICNLIPFEEAEYVTNPSGRYGLKNIMLKSIYGKGEYVSYSGIQAKIPEQYDIYLRQYYKNYMELPPEEKRKIEKNYEIIKLVL